MSLADDILRAARRQLDADTLKKTKIVPPRHQKPRTIQSRTDWPTTREDKLIRFIQQGYDLSECAEKLGASYKAVQMKVHRLREKGLLEGTQYGTRVKQ